LRLSETWAGAIVSFFPSVLTSSGDVQQFENRLINHQRQAVAMFCELLDHRFIPYIQVSPAGFAIYEKALAEPRSKVSGNASEKAKSPPRL
jgi:hypothetical protein